MINIYAQSFMTATRSDCINVRETPPRNESRLRRWIKGGRTRCVDLSKL